MEDQAKRYYEAERQKQIDAIATQQRITIRICNALLHKQSACKKYCDECEEKCIAYKMWLGIDEK